MEKNIRIIGFTDSVNECDCCGKQNLKGTYCIEIDGNEFYYGSTCAVRNLGTTKKDFTKQERSDYADRLLSFEQEFSPIRKEYLNKFHSLDWANNENDNTEFSRLDKELQEIEKNLRLKHKVKIFTMKRKIPNK